MVRSTSPAIGCGAAAAPDDGVSAPPPHPSASETARAAERSRAFLDFTVFSKTTHHFTKHTMHAVESRAVPALGQEAHDFTLASTSGEKVTLSSLRRHPVLNAFFPLAFTSTCTAELCEMRDDHDQFARRGVTVLPISVDSTDSLKEYKAKYGMHTDLLSDFKREVSRLYGVLNEDRFFANRAYFLIDRDGVVRWAHVEEHPGLRRQDSEIFAEIDKLA